MRASHCVSRHEAILEVPAHGESMPLAPMLLLLEPFQVPNWTPRSLPTTATAARPLNFFYSSIISMISPGYRLIELANGLQALLVSNLDEKKQKSACACCVQVGSFSDPTYCQGLAHYCDLA